MYDDRAEPFIQMYKETSSDHGKRYSGSELRDDNLTMLFSSMQNDLCGDDGFSATAICIEYHGRVSQPLTLIDLPGFADGRNGSEDIKDIAEKYINVARDKVAPIVVCVMDANMHQDNDVTINFIKKLKEGGKFHVHEMVIVHNKLDMKDNYGELHYQTVCDKMAHLSSKEKGFPTLNINHFGTICRGGGFTEELDRQWSAELAERLEKVSDLGSQCCATPDGSDTKIAFGTAPLGEHLSRRLCASFRETLKKIDKALRAAIDKESGTIEGSIPSLGVDEDGDVSKTSILQALQDILDHIMKEFTKNFTLAAMLSGDSLEVEEAKNIRNKHAARAVGVVKEYGDWLLNAYEEKTLQSVWKQQDVQKAQGTGHVLVVAQVERDMHLKFHDKDKKMDADSPRKVLAKVHTILYDLMKELTDTFVYRALESIEVGGNQYEITRCSEYNHLFACLVPHIEESLHGNPDWKLIRQPVDEGGRAVNSIPFDAHQLVEYLAFNAAVFKQYDVKRAIIQEREKAIEKLDAAYEELMANQGSAISFESIVTPEMQTLAGEVLAFCKTTHLPSEYSASLDEITAIKELFQNVGIAIKKSEASKGSLLTTVIAAPGLSAGEREQVLETDGTAFIAGDRLVGTKGYPKYLRLDNDGVLRTWKTKDDWERKYTPTDEWKLPDYRGIYMLEPDEKGYKGHKFQIQLMPLSRDKSVKKKIYAFSSADDRNLWQARMEFFFTEPKGTAAAVDRDNSDGFAEVSVSEGDFETHKGDVQTYLDRKGAQGVDGPKANFDDLAVSKSGNFYTWLQAQCCMDPLPSYDTLREQAARRGPDGGGAAAADVVEDETHQKLIDFRASFETRLQKRHAKDTEFDAEHAAAMEAQGRAFTKSEFEEDRERAWDMKKAYSDSVNFICDKLQVMCSDLFTYVSDNIMSDDEDNQKIFKNKFNKENVETLKEMVVLSGSEEATKRQNAIIRKDLYVEAQNICKEAIRTL